jgi:hypothetical protein
MPITYGFAQMVHTSLIKCFTSILLDAAEAPPSKELPSELSILSSRLVTSDSD